MHTSVHRHGFPTFGVSPHRALSIYVAPLPRPLLGCAPPYVTKTSYSSKRRKLKDCGEGGCQQGAGGGEGGGLRQLQEDGAAPAPPPSPLRHHTLSTCCLWRGTHTCFAQCSCPLRFKVTDRLLMTLLPDGSLRGAMVRLRPPHAPHTTLGCGQGEQTMRRIGLCCKGDDNDSGDSVGGDVVIEVVLRGVGGGVNSLPKLLMVMNSGDECA